MTIKQVFLSNIVNQNILSIKSNVTQYLIKYNTSVYVDILYVMKVCIYSSVSLAVVLLALLIACLAVSRHTISEGNVGIYIQYGAVQDRVTEPGVHWKMPFIEDFREVKVRPETFSMEPFKTITKDGIENTFREITAITTVKKDKVITLTKQFGVDFKNVLVFDRIKEYLR